MNEWSKGLVLFSALLSPLAMADWLLDVNFELTSENTKQSVNTSLSLLPVKRPLFLVHRQMKGIAVVNWSAVQSY